ncbi:acetyltransferase [Diaporthe amygdali]|uniref:acetyltransferase n=1 Tax=Phomopsis amygdali TaxID=1214568 RepID=UPI0022FF3383|nr:acetyltransferase [Diaporthe amygdali]KAJ0109000.1 acetyltransferase [Diaporthe amygdali]
MVGGDGSASPELWSQGPAAGQRGIEIMPAMMDDPASPTIYRVGGEPPYPDPSNPSLPASIVPRQVTLRDRQTVATIVPFVSRQQVPVSLLRYLSDQFAKEVNNGDTYPMIDPMPFEKFASYWFQNFGAIMLLGKIEKPEDVVDDKDWSKECLGSFYIKPNYPGRSSHVCNAGFLVTDAARNRGVGRLMGEAYLDYAPKLGYTYSVFNLVYETNVASCKIWDALGFKRIGRVKGCGNLKSYPGRLIDAIIYGRDLSVDENSEELVSEERFDKIKFYLKYGKYPNGADRAEKSRLRSAATHYKLLDDDKLMLKDKEVISDPQKQYDIARQVHSQHHGGINKTTATIAEKYHWSRIKETVSDVIRACAECKDSSKPNTSLVYGNSVHQKKPPTPTQKQSDATTPPAAPAPVATVSSAPVIPAIANIVSTPVADRPDRADTGHAHAHAHLPSFSPAPYPVHHDDMSQHHSLPRHSPVSSHSEGQSLPLPVVHSPAYQPIDPQIINQPPPSHPSPSSYAHHHPIHVHHHHHHDPYHPYHTDVEANSFQDLLAVGHHSHVEGAEDDAVDRDLDMILMEQADDDGVDGAGARMEVDDLDVDVGVGVGVELAGTGGEHDDLSKMSVGHVLATPEPDDQVGVDVDGGDPASGNKDKEDAGVFGIGYPAAG